MTWTPVCEVCHAAPKMDRCSCCENCWYSGRYAEALRWASLTPRQREMELRELGALKAALRVAMDDTCPTCGGKGHLRTAPPEGVKAYGENIIQPCPNPDCKDGKARPALVADLVKALRQWKGQKFVRDRAIDFVERWGRER